MTMAGQTIRLIDMTSYDFSQIAASSTGEINVAEHIDVSQWKSATLMIRVHSATVAEQSATFKVEAFADGYTHEDPTLEYANPPSVGSVTITQSNVAEPYFVTKELTGGAIGAMLKVVLSGTQVTNQDTLSGVFSIDLALKDE